MDINMKKITLGRLEDTDWITIDEKDLLGKVIKQTKLLYGTEKSLADIEEDFANMSNDNLVTATEDLLAKLSFADDVLEAITGIRKAKF